MVGPISSLREGLKDLAPRKVPLLTGRGWSIILSIAIFVVCYDPLRSQFKNAKAKLLILASLDRCHALYPVPSRTARVLVEATLPPARTCPDGSAKCDPDDAPVGDYVKVGVPRKECATDLCYVLHALVAW